MQSETHSTRQIETIQTMGESVSFIATNDRLMDRVESVSNERDVLWELASHLEPDDVVWDVGACLGIHTLTIASHLRDGEVVAFEPMPANRGVLLDNRSVNDLDNVEVREEALADRHGTDTFEIRESLHAGFGRHSLSPNDSEYDYVRSIKVPIRSGDKLVSPGDVRQPNVVKIDVEGASPLVLQGMESVLERDSCRLVILETHEPNDTQPSHEDFGWTRDDIINFLSERGFEVDTLGNRFHLIAENESSDSSTVEPDLDIEFVEGDIANESTDVIVNSAGTSMRMGSGVAGALREKGGEQLQHDAYEQYPVELGTAVRTDAYGLDCDHVVHAVSMPHYGNGKSTPRSIESAVYQALLRADHLGAKSIALPAVGCGLGGVSLSTGVDRILDVLGAFVPDTLETVRVVAYNSDEHETILHVANQKFGLEFR